MEKSAGKARRRVMPRHGEEEQRGQMTSPPRQRTGSGLTQMVSVIEADNISLHEVSGEIRNGQLLLQGSYQDCRAFGLNLRSWNESTPKFPFRIMELFTQRCPSERHLQPRSDTPRQPGDKNRHLSEISDPSQRSGNGAKTNPYRQLWHVENSVFTRPCEKLKYFRPMPKMGATGAQARVGTQFAQCQTSPTWVQTTLKGD